MSERKKPGNSKATKAAAHAAPAVSSSSSESYNAAAPAPKKPKPAENLSKTENTLPNTQLRRLSPFPTMTLFGDLRLRNQPLLLTLLPLLLLLQKPLLQPTGKKPLLINEWLLKLHKRFLMIKRRGNDLQRKTDRQTISFFEISIEAGILLGGKHETCFVLGVAGIEPMLS